MNPLSTRPNRWRPITVFNLLVGLLFSLSALAQPAFLKEGLVAHYPFNGNANDEAASSAHGKLLPGASLSRDYLLLSGNSILVDGVDGPNKGVFIEKPVVNIGDPNYSVNIWFNSNNGRKLTQTIFNTSPHAGFALGFNRDLTRRLYILIGNGKTWIETLKYLKSDVGEGKWNMATLVKNKDVFKVFVNGTNELTLNLNLTGVICLFLCG